MEPNRRMLEFELESARQQEQKMGLLLHLQRVLDAMRMPVLENSRGTTDNNEHGTYFNTDFRFGFCNCQFFSEDLKNLFNDIMSEKSDSCKWNSFESFIKKHAWNYHHMFSMEDIVCPKICSLKICHALLDGIDVGLRHDIALPVILKTVMHTMCVESFGNISSCAIEFLRNKLRSSKSGMKFKILIALSGHSNFVNSLVNFGFISSTKDDLSDFERESYCMIRSFMQKWPDCFGKAKEVMSLSEKYFFHYKGAERIKRTFWATVAIRAIQVSLKNLKSPAERFIRFLKVYFATTTDPFLTIFEVRSLLYACFLVLNKLDLFDIYCQEFDKLMPECPVDIEPRKLTDLSRCQVRKNLNNCNLPLPSAVDQLCLPDTIKNFVLGNITNISRKRKNDSSQEAVTRSKLAKLLPK